ncbi:MAG: acyl carrier protein [Planctomycetota bacterium]
MPDSDTLRRLLQFIRTELVTSGAEDLSADTDLLGGGHIDSMGIMRLVTFLETEFQVSVPPEDVTIENFETARCIVSYVETHAGSE